MPQMKRVDRLLDILLKAGVLQRLRRFLPNVVTVLNYHRVAELKDHEYKPNISASPASFERQMEYLSKHYNVITCDELTACLKGGAALKPHSALITFDDGYFDNLSAACPVLRKYGLPAVIFLATDYIGGNAPFFWDCAAYCFSMTDLNAAELPVTGRASWTNRAERERMMNRWVNKIKRLPNAQRIEALEKLPGALGVNIPVDAFKGLYLTWDQVRELTRNNIQMGAHTASHPILTRVSLEIVREELEGSRRKIENELGLPVKSFAYPNGQAEDFSPEIEDIVRETGFDLAFTLIPGPTRYNTIRRDTYAIRRIFISHSDGFSRFVAKLSGFELLLQAVRNRFAH